MRRLLILTVSLLIACADKGGPAGGSDTSGSDTSGSDTSGSDTGGSDTSGSDTGAGASAPIGGVLDAWEGLRDGVRRSPDHRVARAETLVAAGDPAAIFAFVRDEIGLVPVCSGVDGFRPAETAGLYGARGTLWGGLGSPRDKADLLASLLTEAGHPASVVRGLPDSSRGLLDVVPDRPAFAPDLGGTTVADLAGPWGGDLSVDLEIVDEGRADSAALAEALRPLLPEDPAGTGCDLDPGRVPLVEVEVDGETTWANPLYRDLSFGEAGVIGIDAAGDATWPTVTVEVAGRPMGPDASVPWVSGSWSLPELVGRHVTFRARPVLDLPPLLDSPLAQVPLYLPTLAVEDPLSPEDAAALSQTGTLISLAGDTLALEDEATGTVTVDGHVFDGPLDDSDELAAVETVELSVDARAFPQVEVALRPLDAAGEVVPGLSAGAFLLSEEDSPQGALLRANLHAPRVVLVLDASTSVPEAFKGEAMIALAEDLAERVTALDHATIAAVGVGGGQTPWTDDPATFADAVAALSYGGTTGSYLYSGLEAALALDPSVIVYVTDGETFDGLSDTLAGRLQWSETPVLGLAVGTPVVEWFDEVAGLSGGSWAPVEDADEALAEVQALLDDPDATYLLTYSADPDGPTERAVEVIVGDRAAGEVRTTGTATYTVPDAPTAWRGWAAVELTVSVDGRPDVTRTLAGAPPEVAWDAVDADHLAQVHAAMLGSATLAVEGGAPSLSQLLDREYSSRLTLRPAWEALAESDEAAWLALREDGVTPWPLEPDLLAAAMPGTGAEAPTVPYGPRLALYTERPGWEGTGDMRRKVDLLSSQRFLTPDPDPAAGWEATFARTLHLAFLEDALHETSTLTLLDGADLAAVPAESAAATLGALSPDDAHGWTALTRHLDDDWTLLAPAAGTPAAAWAIHEPTGTVLGLLADGAGSGESAGDGVRRLMDFYDALSQLHSLSGLGGGFWIELEIAKAKMVGYATIAILTMDGLDGPELDPDLDPEEVIEDVICGELEGRASELLPEWLQEAADAYNDFAGATGGPELTFCD